MSGRRQAERPPVFWRIYLLFVLALILFWIWVIWYVAGCMRTYEAAQPERAAERIAQELQSGQGVPEIGFDALCSRFEDKESVSRAWLSRLEGKELTCEKAADSYDAKAPVYTVYAGGEAVADVQLREVSSRPLMFILSVPEWEVASVAPAAKAAAPLRVTVPDSFTVRVNGIEADGRERTGESQAMEEFQYAGTYIQVPELVEYTFEGLLLPPEVEILDNWGRTVEASPDGENRITVTQWAPWGEMDDELRAFVLKNAKDYSNFFSADLPGSTASTRPIRHMFPKDSDYLTLAENYRRHDMGFYSSHRTPVFSGEEVSNYIRYSEDFFSCEVYFDKKMILIRTGEERHDVNHTRYYYARIDGEWLITDMRAVVE